jgi:hypothetical protein
LRYVQTQMGDRMKHQDPAGADRQLMDEAGLP